MTRAPLHTPERVTLLLALVPYLLDRGPTPLAELAETFDVAPAQLRTLIVFLGTAGVPGETQTYQHEDLFDLDWTALEQRDEVSLVRTVAVDEAQRFSPSETAALLAGLHALRGVLPAEHAATIDGLRGKLSALQRVEHPAVSVSLAPEDERLAAVSAAIAARRQLAFGYRDGRGAASERRTEPLLLEQSGELWYLRAWCLDRGEERVFRVDRMTEPRALGTVAERTASAGGALFTPSDEHAEVTLGVAPAALPLLAPFAPERVAAEPGAPLGEPGDPVTVRVRLAHAETVPRLLALAPGRVTVLAPPAAVRAARVWAERALAPYAE